MPIQFDPTDNILICLPENSQENIPRLELTKEYQRFFPSQEIVFCAPTIFQSELSTIKNGFYYNLADKYSSKKITELLYSQLNMDSFKLAIDLNDKFFLIPALICKATNAPIRLSFAKKNAQLFYNIFVSNKTDSKTFTQSHQLLKNLLKTIVQNQANKRKTP